MPRRPNPIDTDMKEMLKLPQAQIRLIKASAAVLKLCNKCEKLKETCKQADKPLFDFWSEWYADDTIIDIVHCFGMVHISRKRKSENELLRPCQLNSEWDKILHETVGALAKRIHAVTELKEIQRTQKPVRV